MRYSIHYQVWRIAAPMILANVSVPLLGVVDTAVVGHLEHAYHLGAVSVGASIFGIVFWGFGFLRMGTTGLTAQVFGENNTDEIRATFLRALIMATALGLLVQLLQSPISWVAFQLIDASVQVEMHAQQYFDIRVLSAPATLMNYVILGWFIGMQNVRAPLLLVVFVNILNMLLDYVFVVHLQFGAKGVAAASLIAEIFQLLFGLYLVQRQLRHFPGKWCKEALLDKKKLWRTLQINMDIFIRTLCLMFSLAFFVAQGAKFGDAILAANALLVNFQLLMAHGLDGFAHAAEALVGKAVGMRNQPLIKKVVQVTLLWAFLFSSAISMIYLFAGDWIISMLTDIVAVQESAREYQIWVIVLPVVCVWAFVFDGVFIGATWVSSMRNIMLIATFLVFIPMWFAFSAWGNHGLWLSFMLFMVARAVFMSLVYFRRMNDSKNNNYYHTISEGH